MRRPDNWEEDKFYKCMDLTKGGGSYADIYEVYEAGAAAMLEALWKLAKESPIGTFTLDSNIINIYNDRIKL
jgi:hypothetical protein